MGRRDISDPQSFYEPRKSGEPQDKQATGAELMGEREYAEAARRADRYLDAALDPKEVKRRGLRLLAPAGSFHTTPARHRGAWEGKEERGGRLTTKQLQAKRRAEA